MGVKRYLASAAALTGLMAANATLGGLAAHAQDWNWQSDLSRPVSNAPAAKTATPATAPVTQAAPATAPQAGYTGAAAPSTATTATTAPATIPGAPEATAVPAPGTVAAKADDVPLTPLPEQAITHSDPAQTIPGRPPVIDPHNL